MLGNVEKALVVSICAALVILAVPVRAIEYLPGVQVGYWIKYGNFVTHGPINSEDFNSTESMKTEATRVSGSRVTIHTSRMLKNNIFQDGSDYVFDVATNETDRSTNSTNLWNNYLIIASNLTEGDDTHLILAIPEGFDFRAAALLINSTETKYSAGKYRTVNIVDYSSSTYYYNYRFYAAYDQTTGMLLELNSSLTSQITPDTNEEFSYTAVEVNTNPGTTDYTLIYTGIIIAVVISAVTSVFVLRRRRTQSDKMNFNEADRKKHARGR